MFFNVSGLQQKNCCRMYLPTLSSLCILLAYKGRCADIVHAAAKQISPNNFTRDLQGWGNVALGE